MTAIASNPLGQPAGGPTRRDVLNLATATVAAAGLGATAWPFVHSMNPGADALALSTIEVDLAPVAVGQSITVVWRGQPVFIRHRTPGEIEAAAAVGLDELRDPEADTQRVIRTPWLVVVGICTHLGCVPMGQKTGEPRGEYGGWFCPCHGSQYDTAGRIRKGPAPTNLVVPPYAFLDDSRIKLG